MTGYCPIFFSEKSRQTNIMGTLASELKKEHKVPFELRINHCRLLDYSCFFQSASHVSDRDQLLPWVCSDLQRTSAGAHFHHDLASPSPWPNQKPLFWIDKPCCSDIASLTMFTHIQDTPGKMKR